ncbi:hypothetical protein J6590_105964 [Homalodisca vitripennis]|nr:hypothetical protein J6590_105964 [Homalodisca vitripennis]
MSNSWFLARSQGVTLDSVSFPRSVVQVLLQKFGLAPKATGPTRALKRASNPLRSDHGGHLIVTADLNDAIKDKFPFVLFFLNTPYCYR